MGRAITKNARSFFEQTLLPLADLMGMQLGFTGQSVDCLQPFGRFVRELKPELGLVMFFAQLYNWHSKFPIL
jgi:hypothetical protein